MKKILILGSTGMLGHVLHHYLMTNSNYSLYNISFRNKLNSNTIILDVTDFEKLKKHIVEIEPDFIVNCIGVLINGSKQNIKNAIYLNAFLPHLLKEICDEISSKLIHISTDCVFSGKIGNYDENSVKDAIDVYGKTKSLGEFELESHLCIRTSIIGPELKEDGEGLFHWLLNQKGTIYGYTNVFWSGVTTLELAKAIKYSIENNISDLWNLTNGKIISKYELLKKTIKHFSLRKLDLKSDSAIISNKSLKSIRKINYTVSNYDEMIKELKSFIESNSSYYSYKF